MKQHPKAKVEVYAVWEPILDSDRERPDARALGRLTDARVTQFWDERHMLAARLVQDARDPQPKPACCSAEGILWDLAAIYPGGAVWNERLPAARVFDGTIVRIESQIAQAVSPAAAR